MIEWAKKAVVVVDSCNELTALVSKKQVKFNHGPLLLVLFVYGATWFCSLESATLHIVFVVICHNSSYSLFIYIYLQSSPARKKMPQRMTSIWKQLFTLTEKSQLQFVDSLLWIYTELWLMFSKNWSDNKSIWMTCEKAFLYSQNIVNFHTSIDAIYASDSLRDVAQDIVICLTVALSHKSQLQTWVLYETSSRKYLQSCEEMRSRHHRYGNYIYVDTSTFATK